MSALRVQIPQVLGAKEDGTELKLPLTADAYATMLLYAVGATLFLYLIGLPGKFLA